MTRFMRLIFAMMLGVSVLTSSAGCLPQLDAAIMEARTAKMNSDQVFAQMMRAAVDAGDEGWRKKHELQRQAIRNNWASWLQAQGMAVDADGNPIGGTVEIVPLLASLEQRRIEEDQLRSSEDKWKEAKRNVLEAIDAYEATNDVMYETEQEAMAAKREAVAAINAALQALGVVAGAAIGSTF